MPASVPGPALSRGTPERCADAPADRPCPVRQARASSAIGQQGTGMRRQREVRISACRRYRWRCLPGLPAVRRCGVEHGERPIPRGADQLLCETDCLRVGFADHARRIFLRTCLPSNKFAAGGTQSPHDAIPPGASAVYPAVGKSISAPCGSRRRGGSSRRSASGFRRCASRVRHIRTARRGARETAPRRQANPAPPAACRPSSAS